MAGGRDRNRGAETERSHRSVLESAVAHAATANSPAQAAGNAATAVVRRMLSAEEGHPAPPQQRAAADHPTSNPQQPASAPARAPERNAPLPAGDKDLNWQETHGVAFAPGPGESGDIDPSDVRQLDSLGDCWFESAMAA